jgi:hypothetical protein
MDIPSVLISDTNGSLASDLFKIHVDNPTISASLTDEVSKSRMLTVALDNVRLDSVPNIHNSTYKIFLAYNGSWVLNKVFTTVVKEIKGLSIRQISQCFRLILGWFLVLVVRCWMKL